MPKIRVFVTAKTGAKESKIINQDPTHLLVFVKERPFDGKANEALRFMLSKHFSVAKSSIVLLSGAASKKKVFVVEIN